MADQTNDTTRSDLPSGLGSPALRALSAAGLTRLEQLTTITEADLLQLHGMGPKALGLMRSALAERGLAFAAPAEPRAASLTFHASVELHGKTATGITVPAEVVRALGAGKRPAVRVTINGHTYRSTVAAYREAFMLPLSAEHREAAGVSAGDQIAVTLELDQEPRTVTVPDDLAAALAAHPGAMAAFDALSYTERKEAVRQVESAKAPATRERRIAGIVTRLSAG